MTKIELSTARLEASLDAKLHICYFQKLDSHLAFESSQRLENKSGSASFKAVTRAAIALSSGEVG